MPSGSLKGLKTYTNADVEAASKPRLGVKMAPAPNAQYAPTREESGRAFADQALLDAKGWLGQAPDLSGVANINSDLHELQGQQDESRPYSLREWSRALTEGTDAGAQAAAFVPGGQAASLALAAPGLLRGMVDPWEDESRMGALGTAAGIALPAAAGKAWSLFKAGRAVPVPPGLGMGYGSAATKGAAAAAEAAPAAESNFARMGMLPYDAEPGVAQAAAAAPKGAPELPEAWKQFAGPPKPKPAYQPAVQGMRQAAQPGLAPGSFGGDRMLPPMREMPELPRGGLETITPESISRLHKAQAGNDLMDEFVASQGPKQSYDWPEAGGRYVKDAIGSDVLEQPVPDAASLYKDEALRKYLRKFMAN